MILVIVGPTGVGKTQLSLALAKKYQAEIINADSMQVYRGLNIGTAKIKEEEKENIPHHLFDICDIQDFYTVFDYQKDARETIAAINKRGKNIIFVGGTGLYVKAALFNYQFQKGTTYHSYEEWTNEAILNKIQTYQVDVLPHINNRKRLVRLLNKLENEEEISQNENELLYQDVYFIALKAERTLLYDRIEKRVDQMFDEGLVEEVKQFKAYFSTSKALQTGIGYKEFIPYFEGTCTLEDVKETIKKNTRHYAKRQETFFKHQLPCHEVLVNFDHFQETIETVEQWIEAEKH